MKKSSRYRTSLDENRKIKLIPYFIIFPSFDYNRESQHLRGNSRAQKDYKNSIIIILFYLQLKEMEQVAQLYLVT